MTDSAGTPPGAPQDGRLPPGKIVQAMLSAAGSTIALVAIYYLLPLNRSARYSRRSMTGSARAAEPGTCAEDRGKQGPGVLRASPVGAGAVP